MPDLIYEFAGITARLAYRTDPPQFSSNRGGQRSGPSYVVEPAGVTLVGWGSSMFRRSRRHRPCSSLTRRGRCG